MSSGLLSLVVRVSSSSPTGYVQHRGTWKVKPFLIPNTAIVQPRNMRPSVAPSHRSTPSEAGVALLVTLGIIMVVSGLSVSFIAFMNRAQTYAGARYRAAAAIAVAEAGVHRALQIFESVAPDGAPGRTWRPNEYSEVLQAGVLEGRFTLSALDEPDGAISLTSMGQSSGTTRRLRVRVYLASPVLLAAIHTPGSIHVGEQPAALLIITDSAMRDRQWAHIAAGKGVWFRGPGVSVKGLREPRAAGTQIPESADKADSSTVAHVLVPTRLTLSRGAGLLVGDDKQRVGVRELRAMGVDFEGSLEEVEGLSKLPAVDGAFYRSLATANTSNIDINGAAGRYFGDNELTRKSDSYYSAGHFERIQAYLRLGTRDARLTGVIYVRGNVELVDHETLRIVDGTLVSDGNVVVSENSSLEIARVRSSRTLPGLVTLRDGAVEVAGRLRVHGLVYSSRHFDVYRGAHVEIVGAILSAHPEIGFRNAGATVTVRYDAAVLGTPGLQVVADSSVIAWVALWEELP